MWGLLRGAWEWRTGFVYVCTHAGAQCRETERDGERWTRVKGDPIPNSPSLPPFLSSFQGRSEVGRQVTQPGMGNLKEMQEMAQAWRGGVLSTGGTPGAGHRVCYLHLTGTHSGRRASLRMVGAAAGSLQAPRVYGSMTGREEGLRVSSMSPPCHFRLLPVKELSFVL